MDPKRVVVVDDSEIVLAMASAALEEASYQVHTLLQWEELGKLLEEFRPDLILMDINMPEMFGDFVLMYFREERGLTDIPILLYSDIDVGELEQRANDAGADGFISKTWGVERMVEIVNQRLGESQKS